MLFGSSATHSSNSYAIFKEENANVKIGVSKFPDLS